MLGGDHSIGYPTIRGVAEHLGGGKLGIIHFDRHVDTQETDLDERMHTTPWFHATDIPNVPAENLVQIGIGGWQAPRPGVQVGRERGTTIMTVTDCVEMGIEAAAERALEVAWDGTDAVWLSFDVDCLDAAFVPGTGWPEPGGFLPREVLKFIQLIADAARWPASKSWSARRPTTTPRSPRSSRPGSSATPSAAWCGPVTCPTRRRAA